MHGILIVTIICLIFHLGGQLYRLESWMTGVYIAEENDDAGLDSAMVYIGPPTFSGRDGYIVMMPDIANCRFNIKYSSTLAALANPFSSQFSVGVSMTADEDIEIPEKCTFVFDILAGTLTIKTVDTLYLRLYKDNSVSDLTNLLVS